MIGGSWCNECMCACIADILLSGIEGRNNTRSLALDQLVHVRARRVDCGRLCISFVDECFGEHGREGKGLGGREGQQKD